MDEHLEFWALMLLLARTMLLTDALKNLLLGLSNFGPLACFFIGLGLLYAAMRIKKKCHKKRQWRLPCCVVGAELIEILGGVK